MISMSSLPTLISSATYKSMFTISITKKVVANQHAKLSGHGRTVRLPAHSTPRAQLKPSATMMIDDTSSSAKDIRPLITSYSPCVWGDIFSTFSLDDQVQQRYSDEIEVLKKEARSMLMVAMPTRTLLVLIDQLERLGLAYHFETEIEEKLQQVYDFANEEEQNDYDLFTTALRFRLLRQHQFHVSCDMFAKFVDEDNRLKENLSSDVEGLLGLYEAAHVRIHGEKVLDEAMRFTTHHLSGMLPQLESPLKEEVHQALKFPLHKSPTVFTLRSHIDIYETNGSRNKLLLSLAKLNFNFMQNIFRNELLQLSTWWNEFNLVSKLPYFRDRLVENYVWTLSHHFEPQYSLVRMVMLKFYMTALIMDETYDNYATLEEIGLLTQAIQRWNIDEIEVLPSYLKVVYKFIMSFAEEFEHEAEKQGKAYVVPYYIEAVKQLARGYAQEQKWIIEKHMPSFEEHMINTRITTLHYVVFVAIVALTKSTTKETIDWVLSDPEISIVASDIIRHQDDLFTHQRESKDGTMPTCMDYYMKDKGVSSMQEAESSFKELIEDKWKDLSQAWVNCKGVVPKEIAVQFMDLARMCAIIYLNDQDNFTYPEKNNMTPMITALFLDSILI